ncbi:MAG: hypothetical protein QOG65_3203, partial [Actinomycetota bacterium]|nr:hypothetical protein [Actinomycetota bacterium]
MERRSRRFPLARVGLAVGAALLLAACAGPSPRPDAQGAEAPLGVTDVGPAPV